MSNIWFTSDFHFGHKNILKLSNRPFISIEEHDEVLISNYNKFISEHDTCYILGDIAWGQSFDNYKEIFGKLNGKKYVIVGNNDNKQNLIRCKKEGLITDLFESKTIQIGRDRIFLSHYPHREWNGFYRDAFHLYGHTHGNIEDFRQSTDIGVDCWEYEPVSWEEVKQYIYKNCEPNVIEGRY